MEIGTHRHRSRFSNLLPLNDHLLTALGDAGRTTAAFHTDATAPNTWEMFRIVKYGDLVKPTP
jgi:hypothetical protein